MINVKNKFEGNDLIIDFSGSSIEDKSIDISILNDVNFKPVIDYLIEIIPKKTKLEPSFEDFSRQENVDKLDLIKKTIEEIFEQFNKSLETLKKTEAGGDFSKIRQTEDDDLPF